MTHGVVGPASRQHPPQGLPPIPPGIDPGLLQQGTAAGQPQPLPNIFQSSTLGVFGQNQGAPGDLDDPTAFGGILGFRDRRQKARLELKMESLENIAGASGIELTDQDRDQVRTIFQSSLGDAGAAAFLQEKQLRSPENLERIQQERDAARTASQRDLTRLNIARRQELRDQSLFDTYGGLTAAQWGQNNRDINDLQGGLDRVEELDMLNKKFGPIRGAALLEGEDARVKGAYEGIQGQVMDVVRVLIDARSMQEGELKFIRDVVPTFDIWADWTQGQRDANLEQLRNWMQRKTEGFLATTPNTTFPARPGVARPMDQILGIEPLGELREIDLGDVPGRKRLPQQVPTSDEILEGFSNRALRLL